MTTNQSVNSYQYVGPITRRIARSWIKRAPQPADIPWTPLRKPLAEATIALISSAAIALRDDRPFDQDRERRDPWSGDDSFRIIPRGTRTKQIRSYHLHIEAAHPERDLNCVLPLDRLEELAAGGEIGAVAAHHYSYQGYVLRTERLLDESAPAMAAGLKEDGVDAVILTPV